MDYYGVTASRTLPIGSKALMPHKSSLKGSPPAGDDSVTEPIKPWTIKNVLMDVRWAVRDDAKRQKITQGEWIISAIDGKFQSDRSSGQKAASPAVSSDGINPTAAMPPDLARFEAVVKAAKEIASLTNEPPPPDLIALFYRRLTECMSAADIPKAEFESATG